jgi:hypothetical protein
MPGGKIGVLVELNCESDFVARTDDFQTLLREIALQVAAANPQYVGRDEVPADIIEREKSVYRAQMENSGKPPQVIEKIVEGKLGSFYEQVCLVDQAVDSRPQAHRQGNAAGGDRETRREHQRRALRALQGWRSPLARLRGSAKPLARASLLDRAGRRI